MLYWDLNEDTGHKDEGSGQIVLMWGEAMARVDIERNVDGGYTVRLIQGDDARSEVIEDLDAARRLAGTWSAKFSGKCPVRNRVHADAVSESTLVLVCVISQFNQIEELCGRYGWNVFEPVVNGFNDASVNPNIVGNYVESTGFLMPHVRREKCQQHLPDLMIIDMQKIETAIAQRLSTLSPSEIEHWLPRNWTTAQVARTAVDLMKSYAVLKVISRDDFDDYTRDGGKLGKAFADICALGGRCGCGSHEISCIGRDKETFEAMELWCMSCLLELRKNPYQDPNKIWQFLYPPVETTIKTVPGLDGQSGLQPTQPDDREPPATPAV
jgi:hypothetical protein